MQYFPENMHMVLLHPVSDYQLLILWFIYPYSAWLLQWDWGKYDWPSASESILKYKGNICLFLTYWGGVGWIGFV